MNKERNMQYVREGYVLFKEIRQACGLGEFKGWVSAVFERLVWESY